MSVNEWFFSNKLFQTIDSKDLFVMLSNDLIELDHFSWNQSLYIYGHTEWTVSCLSQGDPASVSQCIYQSLTMHICINFNSAFFDILFAIIAFSWMELQQHYLQKQYHYLTSKGAILVLSRNTYGSCYFGQSSRCATVVPVMTKFTYRSWETAQVWIYLIYFHVHGVDGPSCH